MYKKLKDAIQEKYGNVEMFKISNIAEEVGETAAKLNKFLIEKDVITRKSNQREYVLNSRYKNQNLVFVDGNGKNYSDRLIYTSEGRKFILGLLNNKID